MLLSQAQIKEEELKLLEISGFGLAEYCDPNKTAKMFKDMSVSTSNKELERLKIVKMQSSGLSSNANLKAMVSILLKTIYDNDIKEDLLDFVKSSLYSPSLDLTFIKHHPLYLSNGQMKKLVVEFFYSLSYSQFTDRVDSKLCKYPIIMQILVLYLRTLLKQLGLHNAQNYLFRLPTDEVYGLIIEYFDLNCKEQVKLYLFFEDRMFILEDSHNEILFGQYIENENQIKQISRQGRAKLIEETEDNAQHQWSKQGTQGFNRSLEFRGIVSESIMFQHQAATPFFNFDQDSCTSFQSSKEPSLMGDQDGQKNSMIKVEREVSLLKQMDRLTGSQQMGLGATLAMKRTLMENQFKAKNDSRQEGNFNYGYGFGMTLESPITLDSPHTLEIPYDRNFAQQVDHFQKLKQMKKSKSEKRSKTMPQEKNQDDSKNQPISHSQKGVKILIRKSQKNLQPQKQSCGCVSAKRQKLKLTSHLYQINMSSNAFVPNFSKKSPQTYQIPSTTSIFSKTNLVFTRVKPISCLQKTLKERFNASNLSNKLQQSGKILPNIFNNDQSISTCSVRAMNPQSDTVSRRQFSPLSNIDRPLSPFGGSKSIITVSSPKITFNYKNPLKYSACIRKGVLKAGQKK